MKSLVGGLVALMAVQAACASGELVTITIERQTFFGQSVFVTADHPLLGARQIRRAVRLSPHNYPLWSITLDLPPGLELPISFYLRDDGPGQLANGNNGTLIQSNSIVTTAPVAQRPKQVVAQVPTNASTVVAEITSSAPGIPAIQVPFTQEAPGRFIGEIPPSHVNEGRLFRLLVDGAPAFNDPIRLNGADVIWAHGQFFLGDSAPAAPPSNQRTETFTFNFTPNYFPQRTIRVLLPRGYDQNPDRRYPVIYAQDGQNVFSPGGAFGSWDLDLTLTNLIRRGEVPEAILVGIDNSNQRLTEYRPEWTTYQGIQGRGGEFLAVIRDQLLPEIASRYRVLDGPENRIHVGSSLGGILGWEAAHRHQNTFGTVLAMSPSFWLNTTKVLEDAALSPSSRGRIWLDSGIAGTSQDGYANVAQTRDRMIESGAALGPDFAHVFGYYTTGAASEPGHEHNEAAWRNRAPDALRWAFAPFVTLQPVLGDRWVVSHLAH